MNRRVIGVALLIAAAIAAIVLPGLGGRRVAGFPVAVVVDGPPSVGECVSGPITLTRLGHVGLPPVADETDGPLPTALFGACQGAHLGEVVSVNPRTPAFHTVQPAGYLFSFTIPGCTWDALVYLGLDPKTQGPVGNGSGGAAAIWSRVTSAAAVTVGPTADQQAVGQRWAVCVVLAPVPGYRGTARNAFRGGTLPAEFGVCTATSELGQPGATVTIGDISRSCAEPHDREVLGATTFVGSLPSLTILAGLCRVLAAQVTGMKDPTGAGALRIDVQPGPTPAAAPVAWKYASCALAGAPNRPLVGTLVGLGDRPLPWAG